MPNHRFTHTRHLEFFLGDGRAQSGKRWFMYVHITPLTRIPADCRSTPEFGAARRRALCCHQAIFDLPSKTIHIHWPISLRPFPIQYHVIHLPKTFCGPLTAYIAGAVTRFRAHFCLSSDVVSLNPLCPPARNLTRAHPKPCETTGMPMKSPSSPRPRTMRNRAR